jgi:hypothetical protein
MNKTLPDRPLTLTDADISSQRRVSRRSVLSALGLGLGAAAAAAVVGSVGGAAQGRTGCTDNDSGRYEDQPGAGVRCRPGSGRPTGCTDNDGGPNGDQPGYGARCRTPSSRPTGCTDSDGGQNEDPPGHGRGCWI